MRQLALVFLFLRVFSPALLVCGSEPARSPSYTIDVSIREGNPAGSEKQGTIKVVVASPRVLVGKDGEAEALVGSQMNVGDEKVESGVALKATVRSIDAGKVRVAGVFEISTMGSFEADSAVHKSAAVHFAKTVQCGQATRIPMTENNERWLELRVWEQSSGNKASRKN
jgi:hypothetical protein